MPDRKKPRDYVVGKGKPPRHTQFKPGQSGNPSGRPKKDKRMPGPIFDRHKLSIFQESHRPIRVREGDKTVELTPAQLAFRSLMKSAADGKVTAQKEILRLALSTDKDSSAENQQYSQEVLEHKRNARKEIDAARRASLPEPKIVPHPDDIILNASTGGIEIIGPVTEEEHEIWLHIEKIDDMIEEFDAIPPGDKEGKKQLKQLREIRALLEKKAPDYRLRPSRRRARREGRE